MLHSVRQTSPDFGGLRQTSHERALMLPVHTVASLKYVFRTVFGGKAAVRGTSQQEPCNTNVPSGRVPSTLVSVCQCHFSKCRSLVLSSKHWKIYSNLGAASKNKSNRESPNGHRYMATGQWPKNEQQQAPRSFSHFSACFRSLSMPFLHFFARFRTF